MRPLIGIIGQVDYLNNRIFLDRTHVERVASAGGIPAVFTVDDSPEDVIEHVDGLLLIEGPDIHPSFYGEDPSSAIKSVDVRRDEFEMALARGAVERGIPLLGVARGMHVINVALGGTLYQDINEIPKAIKHDWELELIGPAQRVHGVRIKMDSKLYEVLKEGLDINGTNEVHIRVNSFHHQAIKKVGDRLRPSAYSVDGFIEAIEWAEGFVIGVQWQPEYLPEMWRLYEVLVKAAAEYHMEKEEFLRIEVEAQVREALEKRESSEQLPTKEPGENRHTLETSDNPHDTSRM
ncbi:gamma-glutamyl-gamma-aminobutyrate hydrolase family protein [Thermococcus sp.]|uniref:gamma-glutamyl-gamma-aminobutyrate hydrolase family protein n=1 Tax=Thermococcus sp. TaxID=35749 RepID=UPI002606F141|nr:gamma-glutamyl-gamma-aminobutyrate hydrolase family protein [Thermococcus sp.]